MPVLDLTGSAHKYQFRLLRGDQPRFWPRWAEMDRGYAVTCVYDDGWTITPYPGTTSPTTSPAGVKNYLFQGGTISTFKNDNGLQEALELAGYNAWEGTYRSLYSSTYSDEVS